MMAQLAEEDFSNEEVAGAGDGGGVQTRQSSNVFNASACQVKSVTVYLDKAEVCRIVRPSVLAGENEIVVKCLTPAIDKDSIRVEVKGPATIADVSYSAKSNAEDREQKARLRTESLGNLQAAQRQLENLNNRQARLGKQRDVLNSFADMLINKPEPAAADAERKDAAAPASATPQQAGQSQTPADAFDPKHMDTLNSFFDLYDRQAGKLDDELIDVKFAIQRKEEAIREMERQLKEIEAKYTEMLSREVSIVLESQETTQLELHLSYVVTRARWLPKYDIRVFSNESAMKIIYYGMVQQSTGEDWDNSQLSLSTSQPGVGGTVPALGIHKAHFKTNKVESTVTLRKSATKVRKSRRVVKALSFHANDKVANNLARLASEDGVPTSSDEAGVRQDDDGRSPMDGTPAHGAANGLECSQESGQFRLLESLRTSLNLQSTQFEVPRLFTIPSDGEEHKVTIAIIDLCPTFEHESVPQRSPFAYLKANVTNTSNYALLAGAANIYVDNNFVAKSDLKAAAPSEEFSCHLGADHGIKIVYKPMFKKKEATQSKSVTYLHKQVIELKNNHQKPVKVLVMESVPLASEEKIKVNIVEPQVKHSDKYDKQKPIRINRSNNIEWDVDLKPGESKELVLRYNIEHPAGETLDFTVSEA